MRTQLGRRAAIAAGVAAFCTPQVAMAGEAKDTLVFASDLEVDNIDPYSNNLREGIIIARHVWDTLIYRDPDANRFVPMLATAWSWIDSKTLEFTIRDGVRFHNGDPLTVDDVIFTIQHVTDPASKIVVTGVDWIAGAEKVDGRTARIKLKAPFPAALSYVAGTLCILPANYFKSVGADGFARTPVGSGPYRVVGITGSLGVLMEKNRGYWPGSPLGQPSIGKIEFRPIRDSDTQVAELISGGVDWIWRVPADQAEQLRSVPNITVVSNETMRTGTLVFNALSKNDPASPLRDRRVRQAISHAIDRKAMVDNLVRGRSSVIDSVCYPAQFGCTQDVQHYDYDVAKAKILMAEAGYAKGFEIEIWAYSDREYLEAIIGYMRAIGIAVRLTFSQFPPMRSALWQGRIPILYLSWGSSSIFDVSAITSVFFGGREDDMVQDPKLIASIRSGDNAAEPAERQRYYKEALQRIAEEAYALPLFTYSMNYAYNSDLAFKAYSDEIPRFFESRWT